MYVEKFGRKWKKIGGILGRTDLNVRDKYKSLGEENHNERLKGKWSLKESSKLLRLIEKSTGINFLCRGFKKKVKSESIEETSQSVRLLKKRKNRPHQLDPMLEVINKYVKVQEARAINMKAIKWTRIAQKMKTRSKDDCRNRWYQ